ncbi:DUF6572 domain-containing protein [Caballeronia humi]|uniref:Uncharacterized protein n=1 Tax=Caballeronia humi TaxID=326474 RepID=A0A158GSG3_9BURK|nr:DUF6572 domain-containing protein [Caballeronia humi]SAL34982.1 hypothetical protein AWB65_02449 [Caballeronia humi]
MSLLDVDSIDYIGVNILHKIVHVGIFDDLDWNDEATHFALLTKKIDRYTQYIRSGQLLAGYPNVRGFDIVFEYVATRPMTQSAARFWKTREQIIRMSGFEVRSRTMDVRPALGLLEPEGLSAPADDKVDAAPLLLALPDDEDDTSAMLFAAACCIDMREDLRDWKRLSNMPYEGFDTSDIPELGDNFFERAELRVPPKQAETFKA